MLGYIIIFFLAGLQQFIVNSQGGRNSIFSSLLYFSLMITGVLTLGWWSLLSLFLGGVFGSIIWAKR